MPARAVDREEGENPSRSLRHCDGGRKPEVATVPLPGWEGRASRTIPKSVDLFVERFQQSFGGRGRGSCSHHSTAPVLERTGIFDGPNHGSLPAWGRLSHLRALHTLRPSPGRSGEVRAVGAHLPQREVSHVRVRYHPGYGCAGRSWACDRCRPNHPRPD